MFKRFAPIFAAIAAVVVVVVIMWGAVSVIGGTTVSSDDSSSNAILDGRCPEGATPSEDPVYMDPCYREPTVEESTTGFFGLQLPLDLEEWTVDVSPEEGYDYAQLQYLDEECADGSDPCPLVLIYDVSTPKWDDDFIVEDNGDLVEADECESGGSKFAPPEFVREISIDGEIARNYQSKVCPDSDYESLTQRHAWVVPSKGIVIMALPTDDGRLPLRLEQAVAGATWSS